MGWPGDFGAPFPSSCLRHHRLVGTYEESGGSGRFRLAGGDVVLHAMFDANLDRFRRNGARLFTLASPACAGAGRVGLVADPDAIMRAAACDMFAARDLLRSSFVALQMVGLDWMDKLAEDIQENVQLRLGDWADAMGMAAETVSRGFGAVFGISPARFRAETRARQAFASIAAGSAPLADVALTSGFCRPGAHDPRRARPDRRAAFFVAEVKFVQDRQGSAALDRFMVSTWPSFRPLLFKVLAVIFTVTLAYAIPYGAEYFSGLLSGLFGVRADDVPLLPWLYLHHAVQLVLALMCIAIAKRVVPADYGLHWPRGETCTPSAVGWGLTFGMIMTLVDYAPELLAHRVPDLGYALTARRSADGCSLKASM